MAAGTRCCGGVAQVAQAFGVSVVHNRPSKVVPVCAYTGQGLRESVEWLIQAIKTSSRAQRLRIKHAR